MIEVGHQAFEFMLLEWQTEPPAPPYSSLSIILSVLQLEWFSLPLIAPRFQLPLSHC